MTDGVTCIRLWDCLLVPLQGDVGDTEAEALVAEVLEQVRRDDCRNVLLDLSGVGVLDSHLCSVMADLARAAHIMGADTVVSGMRPEIAMTLEAMGIRLDGMITVATLEDALQRLGIERMRFQHQTDMPQDGPFATDDLDDDAFVQQLLAEDGDRAN